MLLEKDLEVRAWLRHAADDLRGAEVDLAAHPPLVGDALFHCQQATEKAMMAYLMARDRPRERTHDLDELAAVCEGLDASLSDSLRSARHLTGYAWQFRYPGGPAPPSEEAARQALVHAREAFYAICTRLPEKVRP